MRETDLRIRGFAGGIDAPNPFWLASGPPARTAAQVMRAFDAGWGGAVWKTIGEPARSVSPRIAALDWNGRRIVGLSHLEGNSDQDTEKSLAGMAEVKKRYPRHALIASLMVEPRREAWQEIAARAEDAGADGLELNLDWPPASNEPEMDGPGPAEHIQKITAWVKEKVRIPVLVKLTPGDGNIRTAARAAKRGGADGLSAINSVHSISGIDLDTFAPRPDVDGRSSPGGYSGPAVKPIALGTVQQTMADPASALPLSGIGGIGSWRDAAEFFHLGCGTVQVCTAVMHYGYRIVEDMTEGLENWMRTKGFAKLEDFRGRALDHVTDWSNLNLDYKLVARIDEQKCIGCALCHIACWDGAYQCIHLDRVSGPVDGPPGLHPSPEEHEALSRAAITNTPVTRRERAQRLASLGPYPTPLARIPRVDETECVGCNLCPLVCPVDECITMVRVDAGVEPPTSDE